MGALSKATLDGWHALSTNTEWDLPCSRRTVFCTKEEVFAQRTKYLSAQDGQPLAGMMHSKFVPTCSRSRTDAGIARTWTNPTPSSLHLTPFPVHCLSPLDFRISVYELILGVNFNLYTASQASLLYSQTGGGLMCPLIWLAGEQGTWFFINSCISCGQAISTSTYPAIKWVFGTQLTAVLLISP